MSPGLRRRFRRLCLEALCRNQVVEFGDVNLPGRELPLGPDGAMVDVSTLFQEDQALVRLIRHPPVQLLLVAAGLARNLARPGPRELLARHLPRNLVVETGRLIADAPATIWKP